MTTQDPLLTAQQVAEWLSVPRLTVYALSRERRLPVIRIGRACRYSRAQVQEWIDCGGSAGPNGKHGADG